MNKKLLLPLLVIASVLAIGATAYTLYSTSTSKTSPENDSVISSSSMQPKDQAPHEAQTDPNQGFATFEGTIGCLQPEGDGPHDLSCTIVLTQDNSKIYGLHSQDPVVTGSLPGGQRVRVTGTLSRQTTQNNVEAIINVKSVVRL